MKNFLRALRHAWPYRRRLALSIWCALLAAVLWGLNFSCIYPVLKILNTEQSPQVWVDGCIAETQKKSEKLERQIEEQNSRKRQLDRLAAANDADTAGRTLD